jgi:hypothetical protein
MIEHGYNVLPFYFNGETMSKRTECFTAYWNEEASKVTIKLTPEFKADPIMIHYALDHIIGELEDMGKKNFKKAEKAGLDIHLGCDSWPECDEAPGGCSHYYDDEDDQPEKPKVFKYLSEEELDLVSLEATNQLQEEAKHFGDSVSLYDYRMVAVLNVQEKLIEMNK